MGTDWASLTVVKLRDELKNLDLPTKGVKSELISRLEEWETAHPGSEFRPVESQKEDSPPSASHLPATPAKGGLVGRRSSLRIAKTPARGRAASKLKDAITDKTTTDDDENEAEIDTGTQSGATPDKEEEAIEPASLLPMTPATKGRRSTTRSTKKPPAENLTNKTTIDEDENEAEVDTSTPSDATPDKEEEAIEPASLLPMTPATKGRRATTRSTKKPPADDIPDKITTDDDEKEPEVDPGTQSGATPEKEEDAVEPASLLPMTPATKGRRATTRSTKKPPAETIVEETANGNEQQAAEPAATPANGAGRRKSTRTVTNTLAARTGHKLSQDISDETKVAEADVSGKPKASTKTSAADTASEEIETDQNTPPQSTDNQKRKKDEGTVDVASKKNKTTGSKTVGESAGVMAKPASQAGVSEDKSVPAPVAPTAAKPAAVKEKMSVDVPKAPFKEIEKPVLADKETLSAGQISGKSGDATPRSALSFTDQPTGVPSRTILIKNFVRPLTLPAVKELLAESGTVEHFWMDKIKSHCFATYKNLDEAIQAVQHCHGLKFPSDTGRNLICEFMTREQADVSIAATEAKQQQRSAGNARGSGGGNALHPSWHVPRSRSGEADAAGVHGRQAQPQPVAAPRPEYNPPPVPNDAYPNDKIFNKTKALPPIYYMRLTDEEVRARERDAKDLERTKFERAEYNPRSGRGGSDTYAGRPQSTSHRFAPYAGRPRAPHKADRSSNWRARSPDRRGGGRPRSPAGRR